ncbi:hypothetical protein Moror_8586 [Moniliophthora roreri MCA 2997]|uniref:Uncharacterized protein n=1 Tax=Moniliophthora roreri (strain MCA 2997) TaxID=1381753 RepID=V2XB39_MONRO|nr:hypothetical protein Moror_8586 [Moniliophthora roreri MCA 2997]
MQAQLNVGIQAIELLGYQGNHGLGKITTDLELEDELLNNNNYRTLWDSENESESEYEFSPPGETAENWVLHGSKTVFMLDLLDNLPRLQFSDDTIKAIIWVMKECGTPNVPTFTAFHMLQQKLDCSIGLTPEHHTSSLGNYFYVLHPAKLFALDWANPLVCPHINPFPEIKESMSEFWQGEKWLSEVPIDELSPMWADLERVPRVHFYVKELVRLSNGRCVVLKRWVIWKREVHGEVYDIAYNSEIYSDNGVWHEAHDCKAEEEILFQLIPHVLPADNPQQSENTSHVGGQGNMKCCRDLRGGTDAEKESDTGYHGMFSPGIPHTPRNTVDCLREQIALACLGRQKTIEKLQTETGVKDKTAGFWIKILLEKA